MVAKAHAQLYCAKNRQRIAVRIAKRRQQGVLHLVSLPVAREKVVADEIDARTRVGGDVHCAHVLTYAPNRRSDDVLRTLEHADHIVRSRLRPREYRHHEISRGRDSPTCASTLALVEVAPQTTRAALTFSALLLSLLFPFRREILVVTIPGFEQGLWQADFPVRRGFGFTVPERRGIWGMLAILVSLCT